CFSINWCPRSPWAPAVPNRSIPDILAGMPPVRNQNFATWFARGAVGLVFAINLSCALAFITYPENYAAGFELSGVPGVVVVRAFGILFLMWNATYPPVI